jgi:hypothetical protein
MLAPPALFEPTWNDVMPPARRQMIERDMVKFENSLVRRASPCR